MQCLHLTRGEAPSLSAIINIAGTGNRNSCYATINGTKYSESTSNIEVHPGDQIIFGVYGYSSRYPGEVTINNTTVLTVSSRNTETYTYNIPRGIKQISITLSYTSTSNKRHGTITVTTQ